MDLDTGNRLALKVLEKLQRYYAQPDIEEICINREGEVWIKPRRQDWEAHPAPEITYDYIAKQVCRVLANINNARFREGELPIVSCELPGLPYRFQAVVGHNVRYDLSDRRGIAVCVRSLTADTTITMAHYGLLPGIDLPGIARMFKDFENVGDYAAQIAEAVRRGMSIIVSGATSTGKTTFLNQVIGMIDRRMRVITVEDAREVTVPHANRVHLMVQRNRAVNGIGYNEILDSLVRMTPDYVVAGELSISNAAAVYNFMGKGHPVITTVHADTPQGAMRAFVNNMASAGSTLDPASTMEALEGLVGCIIQLERRNGVRRVVDICFPAKELNDRIVAEKAARDAA